MRSPDIKLSARSWSVCPPTSILLVSASVAPHAKSLQCHELTERALHEERGNAFYPRLAIAASPLADGKHPRKNWPRRTSFSRIYRSRIACVHHKKVLACTESPLYQNAILVEIWPTPPGGMNGPWWLPDPTCTPAGAKIRREVLLHRRCYSRHTGDVPAVEG